MMKSHLSSGQEPENLSDEDASALRDALVDQFTVYAVLDNRVQYDISAVVDEPVFGAAVGPFADTLERDTRTIDQLTARAVSKNDKEQAFDDYLNEQSDRKASDWRGRPSKQKIRKIRRLEAYGTPYRAWNERIGFSPPTSKKP